jgi:lysophospholipase L1-like esterase
MAHYTCAQRSPYMRIARPVWLTVRLPILLPILLLPCTLAPARASLARSRAQAQIWIGTWASAQQIPEPQNSLLADELSDVTIRQIFHLSAAGSTMRVHLSNAFGTEPLRFSSVHIARPLAADSAAIDPSSDVALTFSGEPDVTVPAGADYLSDPVAFHVAALSNLAVSFHLDRAPSQQTGHPGSRATSYYVHGNFVSAPNLAGAKTIDHWYQISAIDVLAPPGAASIVALGDSITDGHASTTNGNNRWTDALAARLEASPARRGMGVLNEGIGGNHLLTDGLGPNALARFNRDVLAPAGVRWVIVLEGINDIGGLARAGEVPSAEHQSLVRRCIGAYEQIIARAHAHGLKVIGGTLTPFVGSDYYHPGPASEADRQEINRWIRAPGHFDAVVDFDKTLRDPSHPDRLLAAYDCGDHLHPSPAGYRAMADAIPLSLFAH